MSGGTRERWMEFFEAGMRPVDYKLGTARIDSNRGHLS